MKRTIRILALSVATLLLAAQAQAATLTSSPIAVTGEWSCLECAIANVGDTEVKVEMTAYDEFGAPTDLGVRVIQPSQVFTSISQCDEDGNFTCSFNLLHGNRRRVRAAACEFLVSFGCQSAARAQ